MSDPHAPQIASDIASHLPQAQRDLTKVVQRHSLCPDPRETAALALHTAIVAVSSAQNLDNSTRLSVARHVLQYWAEAIGDDDIAWFFGNRLAQYDTALREPTHPVHVRATHVLFDMMEPPESVRGAPATTLGLLVMQYCGVFADRLARAHDRAPASA